ncbi:hypothetical protein C8D76_10388 [Pasteurella langaaensis DSM 22999]|uniref:Uncharacterized protein n=1 Tax=Alitibacter langaaensis DSM 22999 TaxID=1122935 RepID=A0A2U0TA70_9PAST|nr:hypothetical protein [Pasteurella langaaensis]PVX40515.1 hypothetical protein C8D76_10388 [Pasteurella langaaensis DSM 22999]
MKLSIRLKRGDDESRLLTLCNQDGSPFDLSDLERADLHAVAKSKEIVLSLSTTDKSIEILEQGQMLLTIHHSLTENQQWKIADYDLQLKFTDGRIKTIIEGQITLVHDVTKLER